MKQVFLFLIVSLPLLVEGQFVYNANFQNIKFGGPGVTITNKVGTGTTAGSVVLYENVVNIGGQQIDAIIRLNTLSAGAAMIFDQAGTGTGYTNNNPTWFSPQFSFPAGGGSALFNFEFILGGSYNNATNTGTPVTLQNVMINSYDIDGNGNANSNQFSEFGGFSTSEISTTTSITTSYNPVTNLTRFSSTISTNVVDASDPNTRVRVTYQDLSNFQISVGAVGDGVAYFFIDFDAGINFVTPTILTTAPTPDLNTGTASEDNTATFCSAPVSFSAGGTNIPPVASTPSGGTLLERLKVSITSSEVTNGASEKLQITGASAGSVIALNFANGAAIPNVVLTGTTYSVTATVSAGKSALSFSKNGSATMTLAEGEKLLDALQYNNIAATPTTGNRIFEIRVKDGAYESSPSYFTVTVGSVPIITLQAQDALVPTGSNASFSVTSNAASYQWQVNPGTGVFSDITNSSLYSGATTNQLTITNVPYTMNNYQYRANTSSSTCMRTSNNAALSVLVILPVRWLNFTATGKNKNILLNWGTANEYNSKSFIIQHSTDGISFVNIGTVSAAGNTTGNTYYSFIHTQPAQGNNYYRIQQIDNDGKASYGKIINYLNEDGKSLRVLSNPVTNGQLSVQTNKTSVLLLYNAEGKLVRKEQLTSGKHNVNVSGLAKGMYTILAGNEATRILINQ